MMAHARRCLVDVVAELPTDAQSPEPMQQGKRLLDDPAVLAQPGAVFGAAPGDDRRDTHRPNLLAILVVVVGTVGIHRVRPSSRAPAATAYWRDVLDHRHELGDVVAGCRRSATPATGCRALR